EQPVLILEFKVVPILATNKDAGIAIFQFKVMNALEYLGKGLALFKVQPAVVTGLSDACAAVVGTNQIFICILGGPTGPHRQRRVELTINGPDIEVERMS